MGESIPAKKTAKSVIKKEKKLKIQKDQSSFKRVASAVREEEHFFPDKKKISEYRTKAVQSFKSIYSNSKNKIDLNIKYVGKKRLESSFAPKDLVSLESFPQNERESGSSPLSKHFVVLRQRASQRSATLHGSNIKVNDTKDRDLKVDMHAADEDTNDYGDIADGEEIFSKNWLPEKKSDKKENLDSRQASKSQFEIELDSDVDIVETLEFSSDDDSDTVYEDNDDNIIRNYEDDKRRTKNSEHLKKQGKRKRKGSESNRKTEKPDKRQGIAQGKRRPNKKQKGH